MKKYYPGMTLGPGESTSIEIPIGNITSEGGEVIGHFEEVPPPAKAPVNELAETLGIIDGLRVERNHSNCRCGNCRKWIRAGESLVWIPDFVDISAPHDIITERARQSAYNGHWSGVCVACAPKKPFASRVKSGAVKWWQFWK